ncbi:hypothetical protein BGZ73_008474 [Actinomortierella ambigua]|nr:hypothetical protein BGZ73_008474 [Actinomortierella ambigua]
MDYDAYTRPGARKNPQSGSYYGRHMLRCIVCHVERPLSQFTQSQLRKKNHETCKQCTPTQPTKLKCATCSKTKPVEQFSKTQRKLNERGRCIECMEQIKANDSSDDGWDLDDGHDDNDYYL